MSWLLIIELAACAGLALLAAVSWSTGGRGQLQAVVLSAVALICVAVAYLSVLRGGYWRTGFSSSLWLTIAACLAVFLVVGATHAPMRRLVLPLASYLTLLAVLALVWSGAASAATLLEAWSAWLIIHVTVSILTFALVTLSAVAGVAMLVQARALKRKSRSALSAALPSVAQCERMEMGLLLAAEALLLVGVVSGIAEGVVAHIGPFRFDHKTVLSLAGFAVIGALLIVHHFAGVRGKLATRLVLAAYLLLALAYPGVKFVTDVLLRKQG